MTSFTGRRRDLDLLSRQLNIAAEGKGGTRGRAVVMSGRRRVGKSRLAQEFCNRAETPYFLFQASRGNPAPAERGEFMEALRCSNLPGRDLAGEMQYTDWNKALRALAVAVPDDIPSILVIDEVPWLIEQDKSFEGALQTVWDRHLSSKPTLLILIGSDLSVMRALQTYERPFYGRAAPMTVRPLGLDDVATMTGLPAAESIDALLITGGFPEVLRSWEPGMDRLGFLTDALADPLSPLFMAGELTLLGEFPEPTQARATLEAIGSGERTFSTIAAAVGNNGPLHAGTLSPILTALVSRCAVSIDMPLSATPDTKNKRYRIEDPYLRFWLAFLRRGVAEAERGRSDLVLRRIERSWTSWRGRAVEPVIREGLSRMLPDDRWPDTETVGGWWNRQNNPEIDLIGADKSPVATAIHFAGSVKWLENQKFGAHEYAALARDTAFLPGATEETPLVAVSRAGFTAELPLAAQWTPEDLLAAW